MASPQLSTDLDCGTAPLVSRDGDRTVVWLDGEQDITKVFLLADTLASVVCVDSDVIVDLSGVTFMSVATIDELTRGRKVLLSSSRGLTLRSPSRFAARLLALFGLAGLIEPRRGRPGRSALHRERDLIPVDREIGDAGPTEAHYVLAD